MPSTLYASDKNSEKEEFSFARNTISPLTET
jgi:hypothetical protein